MSSHLRNINLEAVGSRSLPRSRKCHSCSASLCLVSVFRHRKHCPRLMVDTPKAKFYWIFQELSLVSRTMRSLLHHTSALRKMHNLLVGFVGLNMQRHFVRSDDVSELRRVRRRSEAGRDATRRRRVSAHHRRLRRLRQLDEGSAHCWSRELP